MSWEPYISAAEHRRLLSIAAAARDLLDDVRRRYPGEDLRCPHMRAIDAALKAPTETNG